jgi:S-DNA-T family DNA segregation ATPase FtsK/SpoIIIE
MNTPREPVNGDRSPGTELARKVYDGELIGHGVARARDRSALPRWASRWRAARRTVAVLARRVWRSGSVVRARSVAGYRVRKAPVDAARLGWFVLRGHWRWLVKLWTWATYADLRADARQARLTGDPVARRAAQELIRADATARWAKLGIALHRVAVTAAVLAPVVLVLWVVDAWVDRARMWPWLAGIYTVLGTAGAVVVTVGRVLLVLGPVVWLVSAAFQGRDQTPGAGWLVHPDRADTDSWVDERMISQALAHLGITPLKAFLAGGGQLTYTVAARRDGDGTYAQIRLPLGVTAAMVADRRSRLAANLGRAALETWPTTGEEAGILELWVADKGTLTGGAGDWPLLHDGQVDLFDGVAFGRSQRGHVVNAPVIGASWLLGGRPGCGKTAALRTLLLGAALDPTAELWVFVMGESPDFDPFTPRLARYRMGLDDSVAHAAVTALDDLLGEMERRGRVLGEQPGRPPKVSRKLANRPGLGLHPLVCAIDECHELFQHPTLGKRAAELAVRLVKRGRKYGIIVLFATQSPTKDSIPREITRNVTCGVAFSVADQIANDGLLGSGKYKAGIRATDLRTKTDRGTCVTVGLTDATFELVRTFYIPFEDGIDEVSPVIARAMAYVDDTGRSIESTARLELQAAPVDHLGDLIAVVDGEPRVRTQVVLARLAERNPDEYEQWSFTDLGAALAEHDVEPHKSHGVMVIRAADLVAALARRDHRARGSTAGSHRGTGEISPVAPHPKLPALTCPNPQRGSHQAGRSQPPNTPKTQCCDTGQRLPPRPTPATRTRPLTDPLAARHGPEEGR